MTDTGARLESARLEAEAARTLIKELLANPSEIQFGFVVKLGSWLALDDSADAPKKEVASEFHSRIVNAFRLKEKRAGRPDPKIAVFTGAGGVCALPTGEFGVVMVNSAIRFDASSAMALLARINYIAEEAREWWPPEAGRVGAGERGSQARDVEPRRDRPRSGAGGAAAELARHHERAYGLATFAINAIDVENAAHQHSRVRCETPVDEREANAEAPGPGVPNPGDRFTKEMAGLMPRVAHAEELLREATERTAQTRYGIGMAWGTGALALLAGGIALAVDLLGVSQGYSIGFAAGGLGAVVSVLQRMTTDSLKLVGRNQQLHWFGALRPLVGGLFGLLAIALMQGGLINIMTATSASQLALYGSLAFFAGFNERFAQDALALSATVLPHQATPRDTPAQPR